MHSGFFTLSLTIWVPIIAGILVLFLHREEHKGTARAVALVGSILGLIVAMPLWTGFDNGSAAMQFVERYVWIERYNIHYALGVDGISMLFVLLNSFTTILVIIAAWEVIQEKVSQYLAAFLIMSGLINGVFAATDAILFYLFFEAMLIPMFLIIGIWGGARRSYATVKFVLYTAFGSILMLAAVIYLVWSLQQAGAAPSFAFADLVQARLPLEVQTTLLAAFALSFAIKVPMVPLHTWLPDAHVEAPTPGSVILAGVLLKMGTYGFMKLGFPLFPDATRVFTPVLMTLSVVSIVYGACLALVQQDIKKIIAYSSISHLGYVMLGLLSLDLAGIQGAVVQMVSHGLVAAGLFLLVGMIYERGHTRELSAYGGLARQLPVFGVFFIIFTLASVGLPTTSGFTGEFLVLLGAFTAAWPQHLDGNNLPLVLSMTAVTGVVLGALYMLRFALTFVFGPVKAPHGELAALTLREKTVLGILTVSVFALGLFPDGPLRKTELAARTFQQIVSTSRLPADAR